jgi:membrane protein YqaA with SNARE-associated domain
MDLGPGWLEWGLVGLFLASFLAATVLPFSSEAVLGAMALGPWSFVALWFVASAGNTLGGMSSYGLGRLGDLDRIARWLRTDPAKAQYWGRRIERYGSWAALMTWVPVIGDPIAIALGLGRAPAWPVCVLMFAGKAARYAVLLYLIRLTVQST